MPVDGATAVARIVHRTLSDAPSASTSTAPPSSPAFARTATSTCWSSYGDRWPVTNAGPWWGS